MTQQIKKMKKSFCIVAFLALASIASASAQTLSPGMYYMDGEEAVRIKPQEGMMVCCGDDWNDEALWVFRKTEADVKTCRTPEFIFVFNPDGKSLPHKGDVFNWKKCKDPEKAYLFYLNQRQESRAIYIKDRHSYAKFRHPRAAYNRMSYELIAPFTYRVTFEEPFEPGEYGIAFVTKRNWFSSSSVSALWGFSVQPEENLLTYYQE